jgi:ethanolamine utilization protein EutN
MEACRHKLPSSVLGFFHAFRSGIDAVSCEWLHGIFGFEIDVGPMILARIVGTVVSTRKDARLEGKKLLVVKPISPQGDDESGYMIAVDTVDSGFRETVLVVTGSSARNAAECKDRPVDAAIVGIVDEVMLDALHEAELAAARKK